MAAKPIEGIVKELKEIIDRNSQQDYIRLKHDTIHTLLRIQKKYRMKMIRRISFRNF